MTDCKSCKLFKNKECSIGFRTLRIGNYCSKYIPKKIKWKPFGG